MSSLVHLTNIASCVSIHSYQSVLSSSPFSNLYTLQLYPSNWDVLVVDNVERRSIYLCSGLFTICVPIGRLTAWKVPGWRLEANHTTVSAAGPTKSEPAHSLIGAYAETYSLRYLYSDWLDCINIQQRHRIMNGVDRKCLIFPSFTSLQIIRALENPSI